MNEQEFNIKIKELIKEIVNLPESKQKHLNELAGETQKRHKELNINADTIDRSLTDLRICIKYLIFDLEVTRRERDKLKTIINNNDNDSPNKTEGEM